MTTHSGKYLGARLRVFFSFFGGVPEEYQSELITLLLLPGEKPFPPCSFQWQINTPGIATDVTMAGFVSFGDKGL